jgi:hypothetical protein
MVRNHERTDMSLLTDLRQTGDRLPYDVARCASEACPAKAKCLRYLNGKADAEEGTRRVVWAAFEPEGEEGCGARIGRLE